jgi:hypothetical protein
MSDLLQEFMSDMRADRMDTLWQKYGRWVIYSAISIVMITALVVYISHYKRENAMKQTALYFQATAALAKGEAEEALMTLDKISVPESSTYYGLVLLKKIQAKIVLDKENEAQQLLSLLSKRDDVYGDVGKVLLGDDQALDSEKAGALQFTRLEWAAWGAAEKGDKAGAAKRLADLTAMENAPASMRDRTSMMANYFKYKTDGAANE